MKEYHVEITTSAESQIEQIVLYIAYDLKSPQAALSLLDTLETAIAKLSSLPNRFPLVDEEIWRNKGIRKMQVKHFLVYYWVNEDDNKVQVTAVVYEKREQIQQLNKMDIE